jgi:excinuclease ABC subunit B
MRYAIDETNRRREIQRAYNLEHGITPQGIEKTIRDINDRLRQVAEEEPGYTTAADLPKEEIARLVAELERQMKQAAKELDFERAALLRDQVVELRTELFTGDTPESLRGFLDTKRPEQRNLRGGRTRPGPRSRRR